MAGRKGESLLPCPREINLQKYFPEASYQKSPYISWARLGHMVTSSCKGSQESFWHFQTLQEEGGQKKRLKIASDWVCDQYVCHTTHFKNLEIINRGMLKMRGKQGRNGIIKEREKDQVWEGRKLVSSAISKKDRGWHRNRFWRGESN